MRVADLFGCTLDELAGRHVHVAEIVPMHETPMHSRLRSAFERLNADGREYLTSQAEALTGIRAFSEGGAPFPFAAATAV